MKLGEIIKEYRLSHKESMGDFANKTGLSKTYISMLEKNRNTSTGKPVIPSIPCLLYTSPSPRDRTRSRMPSSA